MSTRQSRRLMVKTFNNKQNNVEEKAKFVNDVQFMLDFAKIVEQHIQDVQFDEEGAPFTTDRMEIKWSPLVCAQCKEEIMKSEAFLQHTLKCRFLDERVMFCFEKFGLVPDAADEILKEAQELRASKSFLTLSVINTFQIRLKVPISSPLAPYLARGMLIYVDVEPGNLKNVVPAILKVDGEDHAIYFSNSIIVQNIDDINKEKFEKIYAPRTELSDPFKISSGSTSDKKTIGDILREEDSDADENPSGAHPSADFNGNPSGAPSSSHSNGVPSSAPSNAVEIIDLVSDESEDSSAEDLDIDIKPSPGTVTIVDSLPNKYNNSSVEDWGFDIKPARTGLVTVIGSLPNKYEEYHESDKCVESDGSSVQILDFDGTSNVASHAQVEPVIDLCEQCHLPFFQESHFNEDPNGASHAQVEPVADLCEQCHLPIFQESHFNEDPNGASHDQMESVADFCEQRHDLRAVQGTGFNNNRYGATHNQIEVIELSDDSECSDDSGDYDYSDESVVQEPHPRTPIPFSFDNFELTEFIRDTNSKENHEDHTSEQAGVAYTPYEAFQEQNTQNSYANERYDDDPPETKVIFLNNNTTHTVGPEGDCINIWCKQCYGPRVQIRNPKKIIKFEDISSDGEESTEKNTESVQPPPPPPKSPMIEKELAMEQDAQIEQEIDQDITSRPLETGKKPSFARGEKKRLKSTLADEFLTPTSTKRISKKFVPSPLL